MMKFLGYRRPEGRAGVRDLEVKDEAQMEGFRERFEKE